jgi:hypothetical protein
VRPPARPLLYGALALIGLLVAGVAAFVLLLDANAHKARVEAAASRALGMDVSVAGRLAFAVFPGLRLTLDDVHVRNGQAEVVSARQATVALNLAALFGADLRIDRIVLTQPRIAVERDGDGRFNIGSRPAADGSPTGGAGPPIEFSGATITYVDHRFGTAFEASGCDGDLRGLRQAGGPVGGPSRGPMRGVSFDAELRCAQARKDKLAVEDLKLSAAAKEGVVELKPLTARVFGTPGVGSVQADLSGPAPAYRIDFALAQFPIEKLFESAGLKPMATGRMDVAMRMATRGTTVKELRQAAQGTLSLRGKGLVFNGADLDQAFERFESSQTLDLLDVGAVFVAGPFGLLVTKGYDFATLAKGVAGRSEIRMFVSEWKVDRGVAHAQDVAMATKQNRVALQGRLDVVNERFDDVTIALVDARGCAIVRQRLRGTFREPVVEQPNLLQSLAGPALRLLQKGGELLGGEKPCDVFYAGAVAAPK